MSAFSVMLERHKGASTCNLHWIRRVLGAREKQDELLIDYVELLIAHSGFPPPLPHRKHGGGLETGVARRSEWLRAGVIEWLSGYLPPAAVAALESDEKELASAEMDAAAAALGTRPLRLVGDREAA